MLKELNVKRVHKISKKSLIYVRFLMSMARLVKDIISCKAFIILVVSVLLSVL